jgi:hypothetical protein
MKKDKSICDFIEGLEMTILPQEEQILLSSLGGNNASCTNTDTCITNANCAGANCVKHCGA